MSCPCTPWPSSNGRASTALPASARPAGRPYHSTIIVERTSGTRTILYQPGEIEPSAELITEALISSCRVLFIEHHVPATGLLAAKSPGAHGIPVVADVETTGFPRPGGFPAGGRPPDRREGTRDGS